MTGLNSPTERTLEVRGNSAQQLASNLVQTLCEVVGVRGDEWDSRSVIPIQAEGPTHGEMLNALITSLLETVGSSSTQLVDAEISHVIDTDDGVRAWGYLWFGTTQSMEPYPSLSEPPTLTSLPTGEFSMRVTLVTGSEPSDHDAAAPAIAP